MSVRLYLTSAAQVVSVGDGETDKESRIFSVVKSDAHRGERALRLVAAYEDGRVEQWECKEWQTRTDPRLRGSSHAAASGGGWQNLCTQKGHNEASESLFR